MFSCSVASESGVSIPKSRVDAQYDATWLAVEFGYNTRPFAAPSLARSAVIAVLADVVELVDTLDLGSSAERCGSSSLPVRTTFSLSGPLLTPIASLPSCSLNHALSCALTRCARRRLALGVRRGPESEKGEVVFRLSAVFLLPSCSLNHALSCALTRCAGRRLALGVRRGPESEKGEVVFRLSAVFLLPSCSLNHALSCALTRCARRRLALGIRRGPESEKALFDSDGLILPHAALSTVLSRSRTHSTLAPCAVSALPGTKTPRQNTKTHASFGACGSSAHSVVDALSLCAGPSCPLDRAYPIASR